MRLNHETGYIWTALTPDIKPKVEGGGERRRVVGTRPFLTGGTLQFILEPRQAPILTAGSGAGTKQGITFTFTAGGVLLLLLPSCKIATFN